MKSDPPLRDAGDGRSNGGDARKIIHNEATKLRANTVNAVAIAFLIAGGVAPLAGAATLGLSIAQILLGTLWIAIGVSLHLVAQRVLRSLLP